MLSFDETLNSFLFLSAANGQPLPRVTLGAINKDGSYRYTKTFGDASIESTETDAVYWIASCTKFVTTVAVMQCVEKGLLDLDADIASVLPEFKDPQILTGFDGKDVPIFRPAQKAVTLRHMLTHSSGMAYKFMSPLLTRYHKLQGDPPVIRQSVEDSFHTFLLFEPGERWMYSTGVDWAGVVVERITSMKLGEYMQRYIFDLVSVKDATFHLDHREDLRARRINIWERVGDKLEQEKHPFWPVPVSEAIGGGGLYATVDEMLKIYRGIFAGTLLRAETVNEMFRPQLESVVGLDKPLEYSLSDRNAIFNTVPNEVPVNFGLGGLLNTTAVPERRGAYSLTWSGLPNCYWWMDIENGIAGIFLCQLMPTGDQTAIDLLTEFEKWVYSSFKA